MMQLIGGAKNAVFAAMALIATLAFAAPAAAQADERWSSEDGVVTVSLPQRWRVDTSPNPSMKLLIIAPNAGRAFGACSVIIDSRRPRDQDGVNVLAQRFVQMQMSELTDTQYAEARVGPILVVDWAGRLEDGGVPYRELTRVFIIAGEAQSTSYLLNCRVAASDDAKYGEAEAFARSLTINGELPQ